MLYPTAMLHSFQSPINACVIGASGGIGGAFVQRLSADPSVATVYAGARQPLNGDAKCRPFVLDFTDEDMIATAAQTIGDAGPLHLIIVATGLLHDGDALQPEKSYRMQSADAYARAFAVNAIGPAMVAKHFLPLLSRKERSVFGVLSARVGSISDNRTGGWHAYRASKSALNMIVRNLSIELARSHPEAIAVALHPGTVDTGLSAPFQRNVAEGKLFTPDYSAEQLLSVIDNLTPSDSGNLFAWDGERIAP
jgi:NAD(P)-dependent dehydrogenase (short-subunit alcohol dehydrogenase family)